MSADAEVPEWARRLVNEVTELRGEFARSNSKRPAQEHAAPSKTGSPRTQRFKKSKRRTLADCFILVGTNAQNEEGFQEDVAELLRCDGLCKDFKQRLAATIMYVINDYGEPPSYGADKSHRKEIFQCIFDEAARMGKGERPLRMARSYATPLTCARLSLLASQ